MIRKTLSLGCSDPIKAHFLYLDFAESDNEWIPKFCNPPTIPFDPAPAKQVHLRIVETRAQPRFCQHAIALQTALVLLWVGNRGSELRSKTV